MQQQFFLDNTEDELAILDQDTVVDDDLGSGE
jgi:hypothetical protein